MAAFWTILLAAHVAAFVLVWFGLWLLGLWLWRA